MRKVLLALLFAACGLTDPPPGLEAGYRVEGDSMVIFKAQAPDTLWWKLEWMDFTNLNSYLWNYGQVVYSVDVPVRFQPGFKFWLDFTAWNHTDTVVVTYMSPGG